MFLAQIAIKRGLARHLGLNILHIVQRCTDHAAIGFAYSNITDGDLLKALLVRKTKQSKLLNAGAGLQTYSSGVLEIAGSVGLVSGRSADLLIDRRFLCENGFGDRPVRFSGRSYLTMSRQHGSNQQETEANTHKDSRWNHTCGRERNEGCRSEEPKKRTEKERGRSRLTPSTIR